MQVSEAVASCPRHHMAAPARCLHVPDAAARARGGAAVGEGEAKGIKRDGKGDGKMEGMGRNWGDGEEDRGGGR